MSKIKILLSSLGNANNYINALKFLNVNSTVFIGDINLKD